jgi:hypothetical protein
MFFLKKNIFTHKKVYNQHYKLLFLKGIFFNTDY